MGYSIAGCPIGKPRSVERSWAAGGSSGLIVLPSRWHPPTSHCAAVRGHTGGRAQHGACRWRGVLGCDLRHQLRFGEEVR